MTSWNIEYAIQLPIKIAKGIFKLGSEPFHYTICTEVQRIEEKNLHIVAYRTSKESEVNFL